MGPYRALFALMDANGFLRVLIVFMRSYESLWVLIVPFAFSWILISFYGSL